MTIALAAAVGVMVGVVVGTLGAGGGILSLPILVYVLGMAPHSAATASLVIVGATSLVSLIPHARGGNVHWGQGLTFGLLGAVGAIGGARLAALVDPELLMALLAALLLVVAAVMLRRSFIARRSSAGNGDADDDAPVPPSGRIPTHCSPSRRPRWSGSSPGFSASAAGSSSCPRCCSSCG
ncbi:sulfite exporter TauE/SafE family protein [Georgenia sp. H159]|uniref:sulfite exporter TauE/SafE family protein n=1 Tax=Georgenia sp. H159 TaxID=3076115 RepID=UPI002D79834B|nr:sulfite exporter TauE/SafE family protein [Georgenia sp. H159]